MITPSTLSPGDKIAITAPAGKVLSTELDDAIHVIKAKGYEFVLSQHIFSHQHSYLAGNDAERLADFQWALDDENIKAIFCARGGYGTTRILDQLNWSAFKNKPKWIVGFSDITALHLTLAKNGIQSIHGIMPKLISLEGEMLSSDSLFDSLEGRLNPIRAEHRHHNRMGSADGIVMGGNLSLIVESMGTQSEIDFEDKILFIEELGEYTYKIDRMLNHLKRAGKLKNLAGLVIGYMSEILETQRPFGNVEDIVTNAVNEYSYPVAFGFPIGHERPNYALRHGSLMKLDVLEKGSVLSPL